MRNLLSCVALACLGSATLVASRCAADPVLISSLDLHLVDQEWGKPQADRSVDGKPISIGGTRFEHGLGTHAAGVVRIDLGGGAERFTAHVGIDDDVRGDDGTEKPGSSVVFRVVADGKVLFESKTLRAGDAPVPVDVDLRGAKTLTLIADPTEDGINFDHADWADATLVLVAGAARPKLVGPPREEAVVLTPKPGPEPKINGPRLYGARPGRDFLYAVPATGERPMTFAAEGLPEGLNLDPATGHITGRSPAQRGETVVTLRASNARGETTRQFKIVVGDRIALTPPMGWNSWNCFGDSVTAEQVKAAGDAIVSSGLAQHGWTYVNIDDGWTIKPGSNDPKLQGEPRDASGRIRTNAKFPDMKGLADHLHANGLKLGIYSSPGPLTCAGYVASYEKTDEDAKQYAEWGVDYLKYDWCSYGRVAGNRPNLDALKRPYLVMRDSLAKVDRDIVYSLCQYGMGRVSDWGDEVGGHLWRTTGDITDTWWSMSHIGFGQSGLEHHAGPGRWNDPDMLVVGHVGWGPRVRPTRLTPNEQYTHVTLWSLLSAPLLIGCDLTKLDDFTLGLLTNDEVIAVNQDALGRQARRVAKVGMTEVWAKDLEDGSKAVGFFNRGEDDAAVISIPLAELGLTGPAHARDLWRQKDLGPATDKYEATVSRHGAAMIKITPTH